MTIKIAATSAREPQTDVHSTLERVVETNGAITRPVYEEGINPALETSEWVVEVSFHAPCQLSQPLIAVLVRSQAIGLALPHEDGIRSAAKYVRSEPIDAGTQLKANACL